MNKGVLCTTLPPGVSGSRLEALKVALPYAVAGSSKDLLKRQAAGYQATTATGLMHHRAAGFDSVGPHNRAGPMSLGEFDEPGS